MTYLPHPRRTSLFGLPPWALVLLALLCAVGGALMIKSCADCTERGGVPVKNWWGGVSCVEGKAP